MSDEVVMLDIKVDLDSVGDVEVPGVPPCCVKLLRVHPERPGWLPEPSKTREGVVADELYILHQLEHHPERVRDQLRPGWTVEDAITELRELIQMRGGAVPPRGET